MRGFGDRLRREREARGVTLGEISESTKISGAFLRALEQEDYQRLPGGVFNRGFVRAYSKFLGLDEDATVADFDAASEQYRAEHAPPTPVVPVEEKKAPLWDFSDYRFSLAILIPLILLITMVFWWRHHSKAAESVAAAPSRSHREKDRSAASSNAAADANGSNAKQSMGNAKPGVDKSVKQVAAEPPAGNLQKQAESATDLKSVQTAGAPSAIRPIRLEVHANEDSWLSVIADGKTMMEGVLPATSTRKFRAQKNIYFTTGNAGGVEVSYNGRALPSLGLSNEVRSLTFTSAAPHQ